LFALGIQLDERRIGLRADIGDEISFANGAHNNLRVIFGPYIRF
jgi:hypothetical protein